MWKAQSTGCSMMMKIVMKKSELSPLFANIRDNDIIEPGHNTTGMTA